MATLQKEVVLNKFIPPMKLSEAAIEAIKSNPKLRARLSYELNCHVDTIVRYAKTNDVMLTTAAALKAIEEETGLTQSEILTEEVTK